MNYKKIIPFAVFALIFVAEVLYFKIFVMHSNPKWWTFYLRMQHYFVSLSLGVAFAYGAFALIKMRGRSRGAVAGSVFIAFLVWFTSCCGAPMLVIILGILGISVGSTTLSPPVVALVTLTFVSFGMIWLMKKTKEVCCKMAEEGKTYLCKVCGAEVSVIKKPAPDPKCPTLICCGKDMKEKEMR